MTLKGKVIISSNASIISLLQRVSDVLAIIISTVIADKLLGLRVDSLDIVVVLINFSIFQTISGITDLYRSWRGVSLSIELKILIRNWFLSSIISSGIFYWIPTFEDMVVFQFLLSTISILGFICFRSSIRLAIHYLRKYGYNNRQVVIVGESSVGAHLVDSILKTPWLGLRILGYYMVNETDVASRYNGLGIRMLGDLSQLVADAKMGSIDKIYVTLPMEEQGVINYILTELADSTCTVLLVPDIFICNILHSRTEVINGLPIVSLYDTPLDGVNKLLKRVEDVLLSILILIFISPVLAAISFIIKMTSPGPILFKQMRYGLDGKAIEVWKFRTMNVMENGDTVIQAKKNDSRITTVGRFLRKTSLDELPQFINVVKGDMSIVGPRPHAVAHNEQYRKLIQGYMLRHKIKPGITGWAQINGLRGETDTLDKMEKRLEFDLEYIRRWGIFFDLKIIYLTIFKGFISKSAY